MASATDRVTLFEDIFEITALNPDGKKFSGINRIAATGTTFECDLLLDINSDIFSLWEGDKITLVLTTTLQLDGSPDDHFSYNIRSGGGDLPSSSKPSHGRRHHHRDKLTVPTLADHYEYVMHGRVFDVQYKKEGVVAIGASFGGLLMRLIGDQRHLSAVQPDIRMYVLIKRD